MPNENTPAQVIATTAEVLANNETAEVPVVVAVNEASALSEAVDAYDAAGHSGNPDTSATPDTLGNPENPGNSEAPDTSGDHFASSTDEFDENETSNTIDVKSSTNKGAITYGYARVSSRDQNLARQFAAFRKLGIPKENIVADKASGKDFCRHGYQKLRRRLKAGDTLVIVSLDRLGRDYDEVIEEWRYLTQELDANITVLDMPLLDTNISPDGLTGKFISTLVLQVLSYVAQMERENMLVRQAQGIAAAKERGVKFGRPKFELPKQWPAVLNSFEEGDLTRREAAKRLGVSATTFDRWRNQAS